MIDHGAKLQVIDVEGWYDAGKMETLLDTNRVMLEKGHARRPATEMDGVRIVDPVYIEDGVTIRNSLIGPERLAAHRHDGGRRDAARRDRRAATRGSRTPRCRAPWWAMRRSWRT